MTMSLSHSLLNSLGCHMFFFLGGEGMYEAASPHPYLLLSTPRASCDVWLLLAGCRIALQKYPEDIKMLRLYVRFLKDIKCDNTRSEKWSA